MSEELSEVLLLKNQRILDDDVGEVVENQLNEHARAPSTTLYLDLSRNYISDIGVKRLCGVLKHYNLTVTFLNLSHNRIGDTGVESLTQIFRESNLIQGLDLSYNRITRKGCESLVNALAQSESLKRLIVTENIIHSDDVELFAKCFSLYATTSTCCLHIHKACRMIDGALILCGMRQEQLIKIMLNTTASPAKLILQDFHEGLPLEAFQTTLNYTMSSSLIKLCITSCDMDDGHMESISQVLLNNRESMSKLRYIDFSQVDD